MIFLQYWKFITMAALVAIIGAQQVGWKNTRVDFKEYKVEVAKAAGEAQVAYEQKLYFQDRNSQEVVRSVQDNIYRLSIKYLSLRKQVANGAVPKSSTTEGAGSCPGSEATDRFLDDLQWADTEIAKYRALWELNQRNAK